jgi:biotin carboxyl carrier protein
VRYYVMFAADPGAASDDPEEEPIVVDIVEQPNGSLEARVDGRPVDLDVVPLGRQMSIRVDGRVIDLTTQGIAPEMDISTIACRSRMRVESERLRSAARAPSERSAGREKVIKSPMPGRVVRVLVAKGEAVVAGQGLVVLEAMKMENEVRASRAGTVADVHVAPGAAVERNATLITLA